DLWVGERIVAIAAMEARIAWCLPFTDAADERLEGSVDTEHDILQDLGVDLSAFGHSLLDVGQLSLLLVVGDTDAAHSPCLPSLTNGGVVDVTTEHQHALEVLLLFRCGLEFVLERFADALLFYTPLFCLIGARAAMSRTFVALSDRPAFIPVEKPRGLS